jgi:type IV secretory pathway VirB2 component (pilin)
MKKLYVASYLALALFLPKVAAAQATMPLFLGNTTLEQIIGNVVKALLGIAGTLSLVMIILGGLKWMTSQGEVEKIKKAKGTITWAIIGLLVAFSSFTLVDFILSKL